MENLNYCIIAPGGMPWAYTCVKASTENPGSEISPLFYATLEEAVDGLQLLFEETAKKAFSPFMLTKIPPESITVETFILWNSIGSGFIKPHSKDEIIEEFKKHPSVPIIGKIKFWESDWGTIQCILQGKEEIEKWIESPDIQNLLGLLENTDCIATSGSGVKIKK